MNARADLTLLGANGFDWSSALISAAALAGLLIVSIAVVTAVRESKNRRLRRKS
jgi:hypothetical protein